MHDAIVQCIANAFYVERGKDSGLALGIYTKNFFPENGSFLQNGSLIAWVCAGLQFRILGFGADSRGVSSRRRFLAETGAGKFYYYLFSIIMQVRDNIIYSLTLVLQSIIKRP